MNLFEIVYQSRSINSFSVDQLYELMLKSREYNIDNQITGCLIYHNLTFIQILEGTQEDVVDLFTKIKRDNRHTRIDVVWKGDIEKRGFEGWSMSLMNLSANGLENVFSDFLDTDNYTYDIKGVLTTAKSLLLSMKDNL